MRYDKGTFELRDNDIMMRDLSSAETDQVVGGSGIATVTSFSTSAAGSSIVTVGSWNLATSGTTASADIFQTSSIAGNGNTVGAFARARVV
jgi:hypothetical protein